MLSSIYLKILIEFTNEVNYNLITKDRYQIESQNTNSIK